MEEDDKLWPFEQEISARKDQSAHPTPACPDLPMLHKLVAQKLRASAATKMMSHVAFCPYCHSQYVDILEARHIASNLRKQAIADPTFAPSPVINNTQRVMGMPMLRQLALTLALALILVAFPLYNAWRVKQNADLRTQQAQQAVSTRGEIVSNASIALTQSQVALLNETTHHQTMGASGNDLPVVTLIYPLERTLLHEDMPILRWKPVEGAISYRVMLNDISNRHFKMKSPTGIAVTQWKVESPLPRNDVFEWGIEAIDKNGNILAQSYIEHFLVLAK